MELITLIIVIIISIIIIIDKFFISNFSSKQKNQLLFDLEQKQKQIINLTNELDNEKKVKNRLIGENKQLNLDLALNQEKQHYLQNQLEKNNKIITEYEIKEEANTKELTNKINELTITRQSLEDEKNRIRTEDEEKKAIAEANRNRLWYEHEKNTLLVLKKVCTNSELDFKFYDNVSLPTEFDGSFKPDFLIEWFDQYIVFDAKMSKSTNLQTYLNEQVKTTIEKINKLSDKHKIYSTLFLIIPTVEMPNLSKTYFYEQGFSIFIINVEAIEPILNTYKKMAYYQLTANFDPQTREHIIHLIASYDQHISRQNAINILSSMNGLKIMDNKNKLTPELQTEIINKIKEIRLENFKPSDLKKLMQSPNEQIKTINEIILPKLAQISIDDLQSVGQELEIL